MTPLAAVQTALQAYLDKDRGAIEAVIADDYRFTSPLDNGIDRATYFELCWPNSASMTAMNLLHSAEQGEYAFVVYEGEMAGKRVRNCEMHRVHGGRIVATDVYFGWNLPHQAPPGAHVDPA